MINTQFTIPVTASAEAAHALDRFALDFMGYSKTLGQYFAAADQAPEAPLVQAYAGALHMALEANTGLAASRPYLARATAHAPNASGPEQQVIRAILDWSAGDHVGALCGLLRHVHEAPRDILAAKWGQYLAFNLGRADDMLRFATLTTPHHEGLAEAHGMLAFGLEQTHQLQAAEEEGRRALSAKRSDAWAQHAVAHVMETQGRVDEGIAFLMAHSDTWADRSVFMREHNWWHVALFHLDREHTGAALAVFDQHLWGEWPEFGQEQIGAVSALWRLELRGVG
ncbi:MAG TPA: tetratricopeptide repeat-containing protein, partial [Alphaproteobacteria bacterium]|nr:tetratricopeptide repeat-containing protein [Alphaproteobacteria bacterium]